MSIALMVLVGLTSGIFSAFFGIGGGTILVPAFVFLFGLPIHVAIGTSLLAIIPTAIVGTWRHWGYGNVNLEIALWVGLFAAIGAVAGAYLTTKISPLLMRKLFALFLALIAIQIFFKK